MVFVFCIHELLSIVHCFFPAFSNDWILFIWFSSTWCICMYVPHYCMHFMVEHTERCYILTTANTIEEYAIAPSSHSYLNDFSVNKYVISGNVHWYSLYGKRQRYSSKNTEAGTTVWFCSCPAGTWIGLFIKISGISFL